MRGTLGTPRPVPVIVAESSFTKKQKGITGRCSPPPPPAKSAPPISRVFRRTRKEEFEANKPRSVSFRRESSDLTICSPQYNTQQLYFDQCFQLLSKLGSGSFGEAFKVRSKDDGQLYAVKKSRQRFRGDYDRKNKLEEVKKLEQIQGHPNCVRFHEAWEERQHLYIQTELCEMSLKEYADKVPCISEKEIWNILVDLLQGLSHLHRQKLVHMDIKPANMFLGRDGLYKIGDFGLVLETSGEISDALEGDPKYMAPELMEGKFTKSADIFSLGVTILELASGVELPRGGEAWQQLRHAVWPTGITEDLSEDLVRLIRKMMDPDMIRRPTAEELLHFPKIQLVQRRRKRLCIVSKLHNLFSLIYGLVFKLMLLITRTMVKPLLPAKFTGATQLPKTFPSSDLDSTYPHSTDSSFSGEGQSLFNQSSGEEWLNGTEQSSLFSERELDCDLNTTPIINCRPVSESSPHPNSAKLLRTSHLNGPDATPSPPRSTRRSSCALTPLADKRLRTKLFDDFDTAMAPRNLTTSFDGTE